MGRDLSIDLIKLGLNRSREMEAYDLLRGDFLLHPAEDPKGHLSWVRVPIVGIGCPAQGLEESIHTLEYCQGPTGGALPVLQGERAEAARDTASWVGDALGGGMLVLEPVDKAR